MSTNIDPTTTKYLIRASLNADGVVEKPDVVGAIFGQTEGLLGNELDLRDLQKSGRIGRIEVIVDSKKGKSTGEIILPSSLDKVETVILAAALESIDRVGPCKADIKVAKVEDVRVAKRAQVVDRARDLLSQLGDPTTSEAAEDITEMVRDSIRVEEIQAYGKERLPAGPNVAKSDSILVVEGRNDVLNLLKHGIKNAVAVEGTSVPQAIVDLCKEKSAIAFVDGDRGGELILKELLQTAEIDFIARAPRSTEVEELTQKQLMKSLRNKIPAEQFVEMYSLEGGRQARGSRDNVRGRGGQGQQQGRARDEDYQQATRRGEARSAETREERAPQDRGQQERAPREDRGGRGRDDRGGRGRDDRGGRGRDDRGGRGRDERSERPARAEREDRGGSDREDRGGPRREREDRGGRPSRDGPSDVSEPSARPRGEREAKFLEALNELSGKLQALTMTDGMERVGDKVAVRDLADALKKEESDKVKVVVFDGVITQRLLDIAAEKQILTLVGVKTGNITKRPDSVEIITKAELL